MSEKTVFISYRRDVAGKAFAGRIRDALLSKGYDPFFDVDDLGPGKWEEKILVQVPRRSHFVLVLTPGALDRCASADDMLRREFELAVKSQRNIVPVLEETVDIELLRQASPDCMKSVFDYQVVRLHHDNFSASVAKLVQDFIPPHKAPPQTAPAASALPSVAEAPGLKTMGVEAMLVRVAHSPFVEHILTLLVLAACIVTLRQGLAGNWGPAISIPITLGLKGFSIALGLSEEIRTLAIVALLLIVCGSTILVGNIKEKKELQGGVWWIAGFTSFAFGVGMASVLAMLQSLITQRLSNQSRINGVRQ